MLTALASCTPASEPRGWFPIHRLIDESATSAPGLVLSLVIAVAALGLTAPLSAQARSSVSGTELDAAVAERPGAVREAVRAFLATEEAPAVADRMGVSVADLSALVANLNEASLNRLAEMAGVRDPALAGGADTIVISATTAIIILLLIILLTR